MKYSFFLVALCVTNILFGQDIIDSVITFDYTESSGASWEIDSVFVKKTEYQFDENGNIGVKLEEYGYTPNLTWTKTSYEYTDNNLMTLSTKVVWDEDNNDWTYTYGPFVHAEKFSWYYTKTDTSYEAVWNEIHYNTSSNEWSTSPSQLGAHSFNLNNQMTQWLRFEIDYDIERMRFDIIDYTYEENRLKEKLAYSVLAVDSINSGVTEFEEYYWIKEYTYNAQGGLIAELYKAYENNGYVNTSKHEIEYIDDNGYEDIYYTWSNNDWIKTSKVDVTINSGANQRTSITSIYENGSWKLSQRIDEYGQFSQPNGAGISDFVTVPEFTIYPNPATDIISLNTNGSYIKETVIKDVTGKIIFSTNSINNINVSTLLSGLYFIQVKNSEGEISTQKLIIK